MLNKIILMGRLTRDPELRHTQTGTAVASFSLAVDRDFKDKATGERSTDFIDVVAWRQTAEFVSRYFTKGRMAVVEGRLQIRDWTDKDGNKRTSLVFALSVLRLAGVPVVLSDAPEPKDNRYYAWIQDLVSGTRTRAVLADEFRHNCVVRPHSASHV